MSNEKQLAEAIANVIREAGKRMGSSRRKRLQKEECCDITIPSKQPKSFFMRRRIGLAADRITAIQSRDSHPEQGDLSNSPMTP